MNKFEFIKYPFFGIKQKPYQIKYDLTKMYIKRMYTGHFETVDDKSLAGDYFARLATLETRLRFDYTCKNLQELIYSGCRWGMDCEANPHDLSKPMTARSFCNKVVKVNDNLVWIKNVSYPFTIPTSEKLELNEEIFGTVVKVGDEWYLKEFSFEPNNNTYMRI